MARQELRRKGPVSVRDLFSRARARATMTLQASEPRSVLTGDPRAAPMPRKTILICDDEETMRQLVRVVLDGEYAFEEAADAPSALEAARRQRPDLVILDVMLPGTNGIEVLQELRADPSLGRIPVVVMTAWPQMEPEALDAGASRFFMKPFEPDAMKSAVEELLRE
jgi:CheY-like chemotaxis protein